mmetsp:Transcript_22341/g.56479  ORF Transcript_22341/g.56479 Transcript_22341/m.56479 type:complete len:439 (-) Transcript_22341:911-2227(-)
MESVSSVSTLSNICAEQTSSISFFVCSATRTLHECSCSGCRPATFKCSTFGKYFPPTRFPFAKTSIRKSGVRAAHVFGFRFIKYTLCGCDSRSAPGAFVVPEPWRPPLSSSKYASVFAKTAFALSYNSWVARRRVRCGWYLLLACGAIVFAPTAPPLALVVPPARPPPVVDELELPAPPVCAMPTLPPNSLSAVDMITGAASSLFARLSVSSRWRHPPSSLSPRPGRLRWCWRCALAEYTSAEIIFPDWAEDARRRFSRIHSLNASALCRQFSSSLGNRESRLALVFSILRQPRHSRLHSASVSRSIFPCTNALSRTLRSFTSSSLIVHSWQKYTFQLGSVESGTRKSLGLFCKDWTLDAELYAFAPAGRSPDDAEFPFLPRWPFFLPNPNSLSTSPSTKWFVRRSIASFRIIARVAASCSRCLNFRMTPAEPDAAPV